MLVNKAQTLRGCTRCVARGLSFQERKFQEPTPITAGALALLPIATADPCSWGRKSALPEGAKSSFFVGRLCKTCALSGYKILGSEPDWKARQSLKKFLASGSHDFPM